MGTDDGVKRWVGASCLTAGGWMAAAAAVTIADADGAEGSPGNWAMFLGMVLVAVGFLVLADPGILGVVPAGAWGARSVAAGLLVHGVWRWSETVDGTLPEAVFGGVAAALVFGGMVTLAVVSQRHRVLGTGQQVLVSIIAAFPLSGVLYPVLEQFASSEAALTNFLTAAVFALMGLLGLSIFRRHDREAEPVP